LAEPEDSLLFPVRENQFRVPGMEIPDPDDQGIASNMLKSQLNLLPTSAGAAEKTQIP
jgi:hypothetical protein